MELAVTIAVIFVLLVSSELWWRKRKPHDEVSRKLIHIAVGAFAAFWPWFLSREEILFLAAAFIVVVLFSKYFDIFKSIHAVQRPTWGEVCFAVSVGILIIIVPDNPLIFAVALLHMSLADGLAAIIGTKYGRNNRYKIFGYTKSAAGTAAFIVTSLTLLLAYAFLAPVSPGLLVLLPIAAAAAFAENIGVHGTDNLLVPLFIGAALLSVA